MHPSSAQIPEDVQVLVVIPEGSPALLVLVLVLAPGLVTASGLLSTAFPMFVRLKRKS